jgi:hypothetical protein
VETVDCGAGFDRVYLRLRSERRRARNCEIVSSFDPSEADDARATRGVTNRGAQLVDTGT